MSLVTPPKNLGPIGIKDHILRNFEYITISRNIPLTNVELEMIVDLNIYPEGIIINRPAQRVEARLIILVELFKIGSYVITDAMHQLIRNPTYVPIGTSVIYEKERLDRQRIFIIQQEQKRITELENQRQSYITPPNSPIHTKDYGIFQSNNLNDFNLESYTPSLVDSEPVLGLFHNTRTIRASSAPSRINPLPNSVIVSPVIVPTIRESTTIPPPPSTEQIPLMSPHISDYDFEDDGKHKCPKCIIQ